MIVPENFLLLHALFHESTTQTVNNEQWTLNSEGNSGGKQWEGGEVKKEIPLKAMLMIKKIKQTT